MPVDVVLVGFGWTAAIMAQELTDEGLEVLALERGGWRDTATRLPDNPWRRTSSATTGATRCSRRRLARRRPSATTVDQIALPIRRWGSYLPGVGVGGAGVHWNGQTFRFLPSDFVAKSAQ
jgi:gluconate 2-dehydrogenase alpha chain